MTVILNMALSVASKVAGYLVVAVRRQCCYVIFSDSYVGQLNSEIGKLDEARDEVQHSINEARNNMKPIKSKVEKWAKEVETVAGKARDVVIYNERAEKTCFCGWLPDPKVRYRLGKDASRMVKDIQALIARGQFEKVDFENPPPGLVSGAPDVNPLVSDGGNTITDSRASVFQGILKALDDEKLKVIGIHGPGGVGKTTMLEEVEKKLRKEGRPFHMIVKAKVSQTPDLKKIQDDIAYAFGLNLKDEPSEEGRRDRLFRKIQSDATKKILIILDDLWDKLDLKAVGIPLGEESRGCKLLLSSRYNDVLEQQMHADRSFRLEGLSNEEAFRLFEKTVGDKLKDEEFKRIAAPVVNKLTGLPLLITSVASTLKYSNLSAWRNALLKLEESNIETIVKLSYDHLKSEDAKSLFLLCGLIGGTINVELLLRLGMGLGLFERFNKTMEESRDRLNTMLDSLHSVCLLQNRGDDKEKVTIHNLYSEVVVSTPFIGQNSLMMNSIYGSLEKEKLENCWAICVGDAGRDRLAELMPCQFPNLKILMLSQPQAWQRMPEHRHDVQDCQGLLDFTYMKELRVLYICSMNITTLPSSINILGKLRSFYLDRCNVDDVAILGKLKALQILNFAGSTISRLPKEIGELTNLKLLNLSNCRMLQKIEPGVLKGLINLEELYMRGSFDRWMSGDEKSSESCNAKLAELKSLTKLTILEISIPDPIVLLKDGDLPLGNLIRFWINIGNAKGMGEFKVLTTMKLKLKGCDGILSKEWVQKTLQKTQYLHLDGLRESMKSAHELCIQGFPQLKHLEIQNCSSIRYIVSSSNGAFPTLESLVFENLINLEKICDGPECFSKLKAIRVMKCNRLEYLWCPSQMHGVAQLEEIKVCRCDSMRAIVMDDKGEDIVVADNRVELLNVRRLELAELPKMTSFCIGDGITSEDAPIQVRFPRLESVVMDRLCGLEKTLFGQPPLECNNLKSIQIRDSISTSSILIPNWILKLPNLESLEVEGSPSAEVVFDLNELKVTGHVHILSRLRTLRLSELPKLRSMWKQDVQLQGISVFQNLKEVGVINTGLAFLFPISVAKCLRELRDIEVRNCEKMEAMFVDEDEIDEGTNGIIEFPLLKHLRILKCPTNKFISYPCGKKEAINTTSNSQYADSDSFFCRKVSLPSLKQLWLDSIGSFKWIWPHELPQSSFDNLAKLRLQNCSKLINVFPSIIIQRLDKLRSILIDDCPSLELVFECGSSDSNKEQTGVLLPKLERVSVSEARRLSHVVKSDSQIVLALRNLEEVGVMKCSKLRYLFPYVMANALEKLKSLEIEDCRQMKEVVPKEGGLSKTGVLSFPSLTNLMISQCPNFGAFIPNPTSVERSSSETIKENDELRQPLFNEMVTFPTLREVEIGGVQCKELWNNQIHDDSFCELRSLQLMDCNNLQCVAPSPMWKRLRHCLKILEVKSCGSIQIIYESDATVIETGQLSSLVLHDLKNLRHIWRYDDLPNITVPFPNLRDIEVLRCPHLKMLFETFTPSFLGQIKWLQVESCDDMELIADHGECEEATCTTITFSELNGLKLKEMPKFRRYLPEKYHVEFPSLRVSSRVGCGKEPDQSDQSDPSDLVYWESLRRLKRFRASWR